MEAETRKKSAFLDLSANAKRLARIVVLITVLVGGLWFFVRFNAGEKAANQVTAAVLHRPMTLKDSIENVKASSVALYPFSLPYAGTLSIDSSVMRGNNVNFYLVSSAEIENVRSRKQFKYFQEFAAEKAKSFKRSHRLNSGEYAFVVQDSTLGILSMSTSDIQIQISLEP